MALHPQAEAAVALWSQGPQVTDPGFGPADIEAMRAVAVRTAADEPKEPVARAEDLDADGVRCRLYVPAPVTGPVGSRQPRPTGSRSTGPGCIVFLHGGGFVFGDLDTHEGQARRLANRTGLAVLAVDYRRPPEHRFPAAPDDVDTACAWLHGHADRIGLDGGRLVALGDSAGGNLALVATLRNPRLFSAAVLVQPFLDPRMRFPSYGGTGGGLSRDEAAWYWEQYARTADDLTDPELAPLDADGLGSLPPTLVIAGEHDVLVDEDVELARRIERAGGHVELSTFPGMVHGFWRHPQLFDDAEHSLAEIAGFLRRTV
jgi:acetyl esterase/lipase